MGIKRYHVEREALKTEHFPAEEIEFVEIIEVMNGVWSPPADTTGIKARPQRIYLDDEDVKHLKAAYLELAYKWAASADGTIQLYDSTGAVVRAESPTKTGGQSSEWEEIALTTLPVAGNTMVIRANIISAGAAGETVTLYRAILRLVLGVS